MKDELKRELDNLFAVKAAEKKEAEVKRDLEAEAQAAFLEAYKAKVADVVRPAFQEFADYIAPHGWTAVIENTDEIPPQIDRRGYATGGRGASIALKFSRSDRPRDRGDSLSDPGFTIGCAKSARTVQFHENTILPGSGGSAGGAGSAKLDELTPDFVQTRLVAFFKKMAGGGFRE